MGKQAHSSAAVYGCVSNSERAFAYLSGLFLFYAVMDKKVEYLLIECFLGKPYEFAFGKIDLIDEQYEKDLDNAKSISEYINLLSAESKIKRASFERLFKFSNLKDERVLNFLIAQLSEFENYTYGFIENRKPTDEIYSLKYKGVDINHFNWKSIAGTDSYDTYVFRFTESLLYRLGYDRSKRILLDIGIKTTGGGSVGDYIRSNITVFKPHILELISYLKAL